jgi:formylglycine-generating enzyme
LDESIQPAESSEQVTPPLRAQTMGSDSPKAEADRSTSAKSVDGSKDKTNVAATVQPAAPSHRRKGMAKKRASSPAPSGMPKSDSRILTKDSAAPERDKEKRVDREPSATDRADALANANEKEAAEHQQRSAKSLKIALQVTNSIGMRLALIPPGEFFMGSADSSDAARDEEKPRHRVRLTKPFYMGVCEVTQQQYKAIMNDVPGFARGAEQPAGGVSWLEAAEFCRRLSEDEQKTYRLPTEAEWEYACRAGADTLFSFGNYPANLDQYGWFADNSNESTHAVGRKKPNLWGLCDMHGNVSEWCLDRYASDFYRRSPDADPEGPGAGALRVVRGGSWGDKIANVRCAARTGKRPDQHSDGTGFRVVRTSVP